MIYQNIALYSWNNGVIMMAIFGLVCLILVAILVKSISGSGKNNEGPK